MRKLPALLLLVWPMLLSARASHALLIDGFTTPQSVTGPLGSDPVSSSIAAPEALGESRTIDVGGTPPASATLSVVGGSLLLGQPASGPEVNGGASYIPIVPADLTEAGSKSAFRLIVTEQTMAANLGLHVFSPCATPACTGFAEASSVVPLTGTGTYLLPFGQFTPDDPLDPADFTAVVALQFVIQSTPEIDGGGGTIRLTAPFDTVPEPGLALLAAAGVTAALRTRRRASS
jgi:hypothetical protein